MSVAVGSGFGSYTHFRRPTRLPVNPLDKSTIVSIFPKEIVELKETIFPGRFVIPAAKNGEFETLVIGPSSWWKELSPEEPAIEIPTSSVVVAQSVIRDWAIGLDQCNMGDKMPGLFFIPGEYTKKSIVTYTNLETKVTFASLLADANTKQKNWFSALVTQADVLWAQTNGNPRSIGELHKEAAKALGLNKLWLANTKALEMSPCPACGNMINQAYPVCMHCKNVINSEKAKELGLKFAV